MIEHSSSTRESNFELTLRKWVDCELNHESTHLKVDYARLVSISSSILPSLWMFEENLLACWKTWNNLVSGGQPLLRWLFGEGEIGPVIHFKFADCSGEPKHYQWKVNQPTKNCVLGWRRAYNQKGSWGNRYWRFHFITARRPEILEYCGRSHQKE